MDHSMSNYIMKICPSDFHICTNYACGAHPGGRRHLYLGGGGGGGGGLGA